jgi:hypothetical protein
MVKHYLVGPLAGDTDFHVLRNNVPLFDKFLAPTNDASFNDKVYLAASETLDFAVGRGADGSLSGSGLNISIGISATPRDVPYITQHPVSEAVKEGGSARFKVVASSRTRVSYQWYFNNQALPGETSSTLVIRPVTPAKLGTYTVGASNVAGVVWAAATLELKPSKR